MSDKKKWAKQLRSIEGAVESSADAEKTVGTLLSPSPSLNWIFGKNGGLLFGTSCILYSKPKQGKSLISYLFAGHLHKTDPDAFVLRFDTEFRSKFQMNGAWGIDYDRFIGFDANTATGIFDVINGDVKSMIQDGCPVKLIIIDSLQGIAGPKESAAESTSSHIIGDNAMTLQRGLKAILPIIRKHNIALILTAHVRDNLDAGLYGNKLKMSGGWYSKHFAEHYIEVSRDNSSESKSDLLGNKLENSEIKDFRGNKEITGHKIYVKMTENSLGVAGRSGEFTLDYEKGLINVHEEIFQLAINNNLVERPNNRTYIFDGVSYTSKGEFLKAIKDSEEMQKALLGKLNNL